jgi:hypothetical protein
LNAGPGLADTRAGHTPHDAARHSHGSRQHQQQRRRRRRRRTATTMKMHKKNKKQHAAAPTTAAAAADDDDAGRRNACRCIDCRLVVIESAPEIGGIAARGFASFR